MSGFGIKMSVFGIIMIVLIVFILIIVSLTIYYVYTLYKQIEPTISKIVDIVNKTSDIVETIEDVGISSGIKVCDAFNLGQKQEINIPFPTGDVNINPMSILPRCTFSDDCRCDENGKNCYCNK